MSVIIIEAPNKCEKIASITNAKVFATKGHFKQLAEEEWLDFETYEPQFDFMNEKKKSIDHILRECKNQDVYIATDPDREGYAIGYMFYEMVKNIAKSVKRAEFHEITESGVRKGLESSLPFNQTNVKFFEAFKARVVGDKLVGFILSPKLSKLLDIKRMSAGRVQTPALKLIVDRELEIEAFEKIPADQKIDFKIIAKSKKDNKTFDLNNDNRFKTKDQAQEFLNSIVEIKQALVSKKETKQGKQSPDKPFQTATMIKKANQVYGFSSDKTMALAQNLYEKGLITYHRTDAENLSLEFLNEAKSFLEPLYEWYQYKEYKAGAQSQAEAHEATRITHIHPYEKIETLISKEKLTKEHEDLYRLIYCNSILSQAKDCLFETNRYEFNLKGRSFYLSTKEIKYNGFKNVFLKEEPENEKEELKDLTLQLNEMDTVEILNFEIKEVNKKAPSRFKESEFIPLLQKLGIGRPSTYHTFIPKLIEREYIQIQTKGKKQELKALERGKLAIEALKKEDEWITQSEFTAQMENILDLITNGQSHYIDFVKTLHEKLGFIKLSKREKKPPSLKQIALMEKLSTEHNIPIPPEAREDVQECSKWLDKAFKKQPSSAGQIKFAEDIFEKTGIQLPKNYKESAEACKNYIEKNKSKLNQMKDKK
ncbi:type IA DNA topoisomerase [Helicobacter sp. 12S02232-10]|uniref:type IA DNA topoisomerase n=1 Tax=Helicobacter sp. 12S02232-10 TaxID=1476197 RepID=UPI002150B40F|nr:type IA DNA topoisomerase [Helicobacter sp. 12S02232-10]